MHLIGLFSIMPSCQTLLAAICHKYYMRYGYSDQDKATSPVIEESIISAVSLPDYSPLHVFLHQDCIVFILIVCKLIN